MLQDFSWLNNYSFGQLEQIRKAIAQQQVPKANALVADVKHVVPASQNIIQEIENRISYIDKVGLSNTYYNVISQWRFWQHNINEIMKYEGISATTLDSFRRYARNCGLDGSLSVKDKLNEWLGRFNDIVNGVPHNHHDKHANYLNRQELKGQLAEWRQKNQQRMSEIYNMLCENDYGLHYQMSANPDWNTIYQKYINAFILSNGSTDSAQILKRDSWKNLDNQQIIDKINKRTQVMYNLCCMLIQQRRQNSYFGSNQDINNGRSNTNGAYGSPSRNY